MVTAPLEHLYAIGSQRVELVTSQKVVSLSVAIGVLGRVGLLIQPELKDIEGHGRIGQLLAALVMASLLTRLFGCASTLTIKSKGGGLGETWDQDHSQRGRHQWPLSVRGR